MRGLHLSILTLFGIAQGINHIYLTAKDKPMETWPMYTPYDGCSKLFTYSLPNFSDHIRRGLLFGPCRYIMYRTYEGGIPKIHQGRLAKHRTMRFLITLEASMATYIDFINFEGTNQKSGCSSFKMYRSTVARGERLRYFSTTVESDTVPNYRFPPRTEIEGGVYELKIPTTCLANGTVRVQTSHVYEDVVKQHVQIERSGRIISRTKLCDSSPQPRIHSYQEYVNILRDGGQNCAWTYRRAYRWLPRSTHVLVRGGKTIVMAQIHLEEAMLPDQARLLGMLSLGAVQGASCNDTKLYAQKKRPSSETYEEISSLRLKKGVLSTHSIPSSFANTGHDFVFELPPDCKIANPVLTMRIVDKHITPR